MFDDEVITNDRLSNLLTLVNEMDELDKLIEINERHMGELKKRRWVLSTDSIPSQMQELGVEQLRLSGGRELSIRMEYSGRIAKKNEEEALKWLQDNGHGGIIKRYEEVKVHNQTLKAFIRERFENGDGASLPEIFNPFAGYKAVIK